MVTLGWLRRSTARAGVDRPTARAGTNHPTARAAAATLAATALALTALGTFATSPVAAANDDGDAEVDTTAASTYQVVPDKGYVQVTVTQHLTNHIPDKRTGYSCTQYQIVLGQGAVPYTTTCYRTTVYYLDKAFVTVETGATALKTTIGGRQATMKKSDSNDAYAAYTITTPKVYNGHSETVVTTYRLPGSAPRSSSTVRVNSAYVNLYAITQIADRSSVTVRIPASYDTTTDGGAVSQTLDGDTRIITSTGSFDPGDYYVAVTGEDPSGFVRKDVTAPDGRHLSIQGWPGDTAWMAAVETEAATSFSKIEALIGQPLPGSGAITVQEVAGTLLGDAYIGVYDPDSMTAHISEDYTQAGTVTHELSHAWFNDDLFASRWMSEGYAQWMERAAGANPNPCTAPSSYPGAGSPDLADWRFASPKATDDEIAVIEYEYDASCALVSDVATKIGPDRMREVLAVLATTKGPYAGIDETTLAPATWKEWLDAVDELGLRPAGQNDTHVLADQLVRLGIATAGDLGDRAAARAAFDALRDRPDAWAVPIVVTRSMSDWSFTAAEQAIAADQAARTSAEQAAQTLASVPLATSAVRTEVEQATSQADLDKARTDAAEQVVAARDVAAAEAAMATATGPLDTIGLLGTDLPSLDEQAVADVVALHADDASGLAAEITSTATNASTTGATRIGAIAGVVIMLLLVAWLDTQRRRRGRAQRASLAMAMAAAGATEATATAEPATPEPVPSVNPELNEPPGMG